MVRKEVVVFILLAWFSSFLTAAPLQYLTKTIVPKTSFENPTANTWNAGDDTTSDAINIGFTFRFNNTNYTQLYVNANGIIVFANNKPSNGHYNNEQLEYNGNRFDHSIYPYWDDLYRRTGTIKYETFGNASNRHFVIKWSHVKHYSNSGDYTFEVVLYEDGAIRLRHDDDADGTSYNGSDPGATIGVQEDISHFNQHSYNAAINQNQDVLYIPNPINVTLAPSSCTKVPQLVLNTYNTSGYGDDFPDSAAEFQTWITDNATAAKNFGSGFVNNINVSSTSNNNPYGADNYYLAIFKGYIYLPEAGVYKFGIDGDDAVEVYIDGTLITAWYGGHGRAGHATRVKYVNASSGYHKVEYHFQERTGGDNYYLYWQRPIESSITVVPASRFFHCTPSLAKTSCVIRDPVNGITRPKRIPGATIRYALTVDNVTDDSMNNVIVEDVLNSSFDTATIKNIQIQNGTCDCLGVTSSSNNGANGTGNGVNPVKLDYGTVLDNSVECGYFEVDIK